MAEKVNQEIEWQFDLDDLDQVRDLVVKFVQTLPYQKAFKKPITQSDTYLDVDDFTFYNAGFSLRIRKHGKYYEAALKSLADTRDHGVVRSPTRTQIAQRIGGPSVVHLMKAKGDLGKALRARHPKSIFQELFVLRTEREKILLSTSDKPFAEIALDYTTQVDDPHREAPLVLYRLEIEVKDRAYMLTVQDIVDRLKKFLRAKHAVAKAATMSKFQMSFAHNRIRTFLRDFGPYSFANKMSIEAYIVAVFRKNLEAAFHNEAGCRLGYEVEFVHRMRVGLRKLISAYKVLIEYIPPRLMPYRAFFKLVIAHLGEVRDLDVHIAELSNAKELAESHGQEPVDEIIEALRKKRVLAHEKLLEVFNSRVYTRMHRALAKTIHDPALISRETKQANAIYPALACRIIKEFHAAGQKLDIDAKAKRFHKVRIKGKELRYTLEFFKPLAEKAMGSLIAIMADIQDHLGAINDSRAAKDRLIELCRRHTKDMSPYAVFVMGEACMQNIVSDRDNRKKFIEGFTAITWSQLAKKIGAS